MAQISKRAAKDIAKKLGARFNRGRRKHLRVQISVDGQVCAAYGISHGLHNSNMHIPKQLGITLSDAIRLASCQLSKGWYFERVRAVGERAAAGDSGQDQPLDVTGSKLALTAPKVGAS